jgi:hypothetical protein
MLWDGSSILIATGVAVHGGANYARMQVIVILCRNKLCKQPVFEDDNLVSVNLCL